jgi:hypothetical protein
MSGVGLGWGDPPLETGRHIALFWRILWRSTGMYRDRDSDRDSDSYSTSYEASLSSMPIWYCA